MQPNLCAEDEISVSCGYLRAWGHTWMQLNHHGTFHDGTRSILLRALLFDLQLAFALFFVCFIATWQASVQIWLVLDGTWRVSAARIHCKGHIERRIALCSPPRHVLTTQPGGLPCAHSSKMDAATPYPAPRSSSEAVPDIETGIAAPLPLPTNAPQDQIREEEEELSGRPPTMVPASTKDNPDEDKVPVGAGDESPMPRCGEGVASTAFRASGPRTSGVHLQKDNEEEEEEDPLIVATRTQCLGLLRKLFYVVMPLSIVASIYACLYGWIFVNTPTYLQDPTSWQRCIVYNTNNANATPQNFAVSASAFGGMMFIFMGLGFKAGYLGLQDMDLLPYSLTVTCYTLLGQLVYRPVNPVVPAITELTPTLISLASFLRPGMYADVPDAAGACQHARRVNVSFLAFVLVLFAANFCNLLLLLYATYRTRRVPRSSRYLLVWHRPALCLVGLAIAAYIVTIAAKEDAALKTLFLLDKVGHGYLFPFQRPTLDTVGLFLLLTVASVVYGACKQEPESFKWASFTAYVHVLLSYPILIR